MDRNMMLHTLENNREDFQLRHPATAEMDIPVFRAYCAGKSAVQIAATIPCSESTVYRSVRRVKDYLQVQEEMDFMAVLRQHIADHAPNYGEWDAGSVLDMLYASYCDYNRIDPEMEHAMYAAVYKLLEQLPYKSIDSVMDAVCNLCHSRARSGFTAGVKLGVQLADGLRA